MAVAPLVDNADNDNDNAADGVVDHRDGAALFVGARRYRLHRRDVPLRLESSPSDGLLLVVARRGRCVGDAALPVAGFFVARCDVRPSARIGVTTLCSWRPSWSTSTPTTIASPD